jgi:riboflavin kinase/FMN adenylyltransferase
MCVVAPLRRPKLIQSRRQQLEALESTGLGGVLILEFTPELAMLTGQQFFEETLGSRVPLASLSVGRNFRFGRNRSGDIDLLRKIGRERGIEITEVPSITFDDDVVSSSRIRLRIGEGKVERARRMLGRPFALEGKVVAGVGRGRKLSYPTANLDPENELIPRPGVYVTETLVRAARQPSVTNIGNRPTFDGEELTVESHLLGFDENIYGERIEVRFLARIRDEMKFSGPAELSDQIGRDLATAQAYFENARITVP